MTGDRRGAARHSGASGAGRGPGPSGRGARAAGRGPSGPAPRKRGRIAAAVAGQRKITAATVAVLCVAGAAVGWLVVSRSPRTSPAAHEAQAVTAPKPQLGVTALATLRLNAPRYSSPGVRGKGTVPGQWYGYPSILPVISTSPGWLEVRLAQRPNGSTAWIPAADAMLSTTSYRIVVNLADTKLTLYDNGRPVFTAPAGVGAPDDPTPPGQYFVAFIEPPPQPNPGYGPFIMVTSDHSRTISDWEGSGDAVIGIHGPLGQSLAIGTTGAHLSHGCIRLQPAAQLKLSGVPAGTPITITG
jgi:lipoprotein-anchoring transpeptidase ErfK/SrfK